MTLRVFTLSYISSFTEALVWVQRLILCNHWAIMLVCLLPRRAMYALSFIGLQDFEDSLTTTED